jgi:hypothetical protein
VDPLKVDGELEEDAQVVVEVPRVEPRVEVPRLGVEEEADRLVK